MTQDRAKDSLNDVACFGRVAVVMGGDSAEREVSLNSGAGVLAALRSVGVDAFGVDGIPALLSAIQSGKVDRVFNVLHGRGGEDGVLQGLLASLRVPCTGSGVLGSALSMDKVRSKRVWQALGLPTPAFAVLRAGEDVGRAVAEIGLPVVVKPSREGSSVGITRVREAADLAAAVELITGFFEFDRFDCFWRKRGTLELLKQYVEVRALRHEVEEGLATFLLWSVGFHLLAHDDRGVRNHLTQGLVVICEMPLDNVFGEIDCVTKLRL